jgi:glutamyl-tRNA synthetase
MPDRVRVRFAPSPTGPLHMGGVRTALYNYLFARHHGGDFILRIEDTDRQRFVPGAEEYIIESLKWCGIPPNEGVGFGDGKYAPYRQSERKDLYRQYAEQLVASGNAYYAFDTPDELEAMRKRLEAGGQHNIAYSAASRMEMTNSLTLAQDEVTRRLSEGGAYVIRIRMPQDETVHVNDLIRGDIHVNTSLLDDKVLFKGDGMPTYHLANVVDDYLMKITHVIRGEEWLPSAPLHVLLYRFLGWEDVMPRFAHLPLLLKPDGNGKLSKRDGDRLGFPVFPLEWKDPVSGEVSSGYREKGYSPEAFVNLLALLGWNPGSEQELFTPDELAQQFSMEHVHKSGARFDPEKAVWFNAQWLRRQPEEVLAQRLGRDAAAAYGLEPGDPRLQPYFLSAAVSLLRERVHFEQELIVKGACLFAPPASYDATVVAKKWKASHAAFFEHLTAAYSGMESFDAAGAEAVFKETAAADGLKPGEVLQLFRVFLSGEGGGMDLFPMSALLGKEEVVRRIVAALKKMPA